MDLWIPYDLPDGQRYYYHRITGETSWSLPSSHQIAYTPWRQLTDHAGRFFWFNTSTKVTSWKRPPELQFNSSARDSPAPEDSSLQPESDFLPHSTIPAEESFFGVLRDSGITSEMSWENALSQIHTHPNYKSTLTSLAERKAAFYKYMDILQQCLVSRRRYEDALAKKNFISLIRSHSQFVCFDAAASMPFQSAWSHLRDNICKHPDYLAFGDERTRADVFRELRGTMLEEKARADHEAHLKQLESLEANILQMYSSENHIPLTITWHNAEPLILASPSNNELIRGLSPLEILKCFEAASKRAIEQQEDKDRLVDIEFLANSIQAKTCFKDLLGNLINDGLMAPLSKWANFYHQFTSGQFQQQVNPLLESGNSPISYFLDALDSLQEAYKPDREACLHILQSTFGSRLPENERFSRTDFRSLVCDSHVRIEDSRNLEFAYQEFLIDVSVTSTISKPAYAFTKSMHNDSTDEILAAYKRFLKKHEPAITPDTQWHEIQREIASLRTYDGLSESTKQTYFEKYIRKFCSDEHRATATD